jgi:trk system potassium uptake protein TrkH
LRHEQGDYLLKHWLNCLFTAVSATCVTGLTVYDTGADFTRFGQTVILALIQLGGLGIMIFGSLIGILVGRQLSLRQSLVLQDALSHQTLGQLRRVVVFVLVTTSACELAGTAALYTMWPTTVGPAGTRLFYSVFHAVSAFCNAGFSLQSDSLVPYRGAWQVYGAVMPLIVLGGLGFPVLSDLYQAVRSRLVPAVARWRAGPAVAPMVRPRPRVHRLSLHSKLVLTATIPMILLPALAFYTFETMERDRRDHRSDEAAGLLSPAMADMTVADRMATALFQSVTTRTAGFNTAAQDPESLSPASMFLTVLLMFVGGSPASTAGGVKTVSVAILVLAIHSTLRGRRAVEGFHRTIPRDAVRRAAVVVIVMFGLASLVTLLLAAAERGASLAEVLFESVSACGTVGLSTGLTPRLTVVGRIIIMLGMFAGRMGPLTLLVVLAGKGAAARYEYPHEQVVIG